MWALRTGRTRGLGETRGAAEEDEKLDECLAVGRPRQPTRVPLPPQPARTATLIMAQTIARTKGLYGL